MVGSQGNLINHALHNWLSQQLTRVHERHPLPISCTRVMEQGKNNVDQKQLLCVSSSRDIQYCMLLCWQPWLCPQWRWLGRCSWAVTKPHLWRSLQWHWQWMVLCAVVTLATDSTLHPIFLVLLHHFLITSEIAHRYSWNLVINVKPLQTTPLICFSIPYN